MGAFLSDIQEYPDLTVKQLLEFFAIGIADNREENEEEEQHKNKSQHGPKKQIK